MKVCVNGDVKNIHMYIKYSIYQFRPTNLIRTFNKKKSSLTIFFYVFINVTRKLT